MKHRLFILFGILLFVSDVKAQKSFRLKLVGYFQNPDSSIETDTLYFGCDSLGGDGYQNGLDILDTSFQPNAFANRWYINDPVIQQQLNTRSPYNTQQNIKAFTYNKWINWKTYFTGRMVGLKFDTTELNYQDGSKKFYSAGISCIGCSIGVWENDQLSFVTNRHNGINYFYEDSIAILETNNELNFYFALQDTLQSGLHEEKEQPFVILPNPVFDFLTLQFNKPLQGTLNILNMYGKFISKEEVTFSREHQLKIDMSNHAPGCYFITFIPTDATYTYSTIRVIKQ